MLPYLEKAISIALTYGKKPVIKLVPVVSLGRLRKYFDNSFPFTVGLKDDFRKRLNSSVKRIVAIS